jgi:hypothetical protein
LNNDAALIPSEPISPTSITPIIPTQPSALDKIFMGKDGLRAGWSLLIFIALFAALIFCANIIGHKLHPPAAEAAKATGAELSVSRSLSSEFVPFLVVLFITWIMSKIERRPNSVYGLGGRGTFPQYFLAGLGWGITCLSLLIVTLWKSGLLVIDNRLLYGSDIFRYGTIWLLGFFLVGLLEEYLTRGYLQYTLTRGLSCIYELALKSRYSKVLGFWTAAAIFSILFGLGTAATRASRRSDCFLLAWRRWSSASVFGAPALYGGRLGSTPRGTGASRFSTASLTAELWYSTISSPRIPWGNPFGAAE